MRHLIEKYERELADLKHELTHELPKEIQRAVALGDLRENAEYTAALERQRYVQARLGQLTQKLTQLATMRTAQIPRDRVAFGSLVTVRNLDSDEDTVFEIVLPDDGDASQGQISTSSPIGRALLGKTVGEEVQVKTPGGERNFEILDLVTIHDRENEANGTHGG